MRKTELEQRIRELEAELARKEQRIQDLEDVGHVGAIKGYMLAIEACESWKECEDALQAELAEERRLHHQWRDDYSTLNIECIRLNSELSKAKRENKARLLLGPK